MSQKQSKCQVCFQADKSLPKCNSCLRAAHPTCYRFKDSHCQPCKNKVKKPLCRYCGNGGLLHKISQDYYCHMICGLFSEQLLKIRNIAKYPIKQISGTLCQSCKNICKGQSYIFCYSDHKTLIPIHYYCLLKEAYKTQKKKWKVAFKSIIDKQNKQKPTCLAYNNFILNNFKEDQVTGEDIAQLRDDYSNTLGQTMVITACQKHDIQYTYCSCGQQTQINLVYCQRCNCWLHIKCQKYKQTKEDYVCNRCRNVKDKLPDKLQKIPYLLTFKQFLQLGTILQNKNQKGQLYKCLISGDNQKLIQMFQSNKLYKKYKKTELMIKIQQKLKRQKVTTKVIQPQAKQKKQSYVQQKLKRQKVSSKVMQPQTNQKKQKYVQQKLKRQKVSTKVLQSQINQKKQTQIQQKQKSSKNYLQIDTLKTVDTAKQYQYQIKDLVKKQRYSQLLGSQFINKWPKNTKQSQTLSVILRICKILQKALNQRNQNLSVIDEQGCNIKLILARDGLIKIKDNIQCLNQKQPLFNFIKKVEGKIKEIQSQVYQLQGKTYSQYYQPALKKIVSGWYHPKSLNQKIKRLNIIKSQTYTFDMFKQQINNCDFISNLSKIVRQYSHLNQTAFYKQCLSFLKVATFLIPKIPITSNFLQNFIQSNKILALIQNGICMIKDMDKPYKIIRKMMCKLKTIRLHTRLSIKVFEQQSKPVFSSVFLQNILKLMSESGYPQNKVKERIKTLHQNYSMKKLVYDRLIYDKPTYQQCLQFLYSIKNLKLSMPVQECTINLIIEQSQQFQSRIQSKYELLQSHPVAQKDEQIFSGLSTFINYQKKIYKKLKISLQRIDKLIICQRMVDTYQAIHSKQITVDRILKLIQFVKQQQMNKQQHESLYLINRQSLLEITQRGKPAIKFFEKKQLIQKNCQNLLIARLAVLDKPNFIQNLYNIKQKMGLYTTRQLKNILNQLKCLRLCQSQNSGLSKMLQQQEKLIKILQNSQQTLNHYKQLLTALLSLPVLTGRQKEFVNLYVKAKAIDKEAQILLNNLQNNNRLQQKHINTLYICYNHAIKGENTKACSNIYNQILCMNQLVLQNQNPLILIKLIDTLSHLPAYLFNYYKESLSKFAFRLIDIANQQARIDDVILLTNLSKKKRVSIDKSKQITTITSQAVKSNDQSDQQSSSQQVNQSVNQSNESNSSIIQKNEVSISD